MRIAIVNPYVVSSGHHQAKSPAHYHNQSKRFVESYVEFHPETTPDFIVVPSGGPLPPEGRKLYEGISTSEMEYVGGGWCEGAYIEAAKQFSDYDLLLCLISSIHFNRHGWFERLISAHSHHGDGLYGPMTSFEMTPHVRSCCLMCSPESLSSYPLPVNEFLSAHRFEHYKKESFTDHVESLGKPVMMVTWDGVYKKQDWRTPDNVFRKGDQSNCLMLDHHADDFNTSSSGEKAVLQSTSDGH